MDLINAYEPINAVEVRDPRTAVKSQHDYAVLKAGSQTSFKAWTSTAISNSAIQFSCPPPSGGIFVDSAISLTLPVRLTFVGTAPIGSTLINDIFDAPRAYPISGSIETLSATINNQSVAINTSDIIHALSRYNTGMDLKNGNYSTFPNYPDQSQQYNDIAGTSRNPLGLYSDGIDGTPQQRGAFPYTIVSNPVSTNPVVPITAIIEMAPTEPIFLPPFYFGDKSRQAFFNINSMDFSITFVNNLANRMWSHNDQGGTINITSATCNIGGTSGGPVAPPTMNICYLTPQETQILGQNQPSVYPYFDIQRYPTQQGAFAAGQTQTIYSNNIQLSSIPRRMYIYVRESNQVLYSNSTVTDTFFSIEKLSIQFMNQNGLLSSASKAQLYQMCQKNHCNMSWTQWSGGPSNKTGTGGIYTVGSVICIEFARDIGLGSLDAPGKIGQFQLYVEVSATNISARTITPTLYLVPVLEGVFEIPSLGTAVKNIGVLSSKNILDARGKAGYTYDMVEDVSGGNFFSGIKDYFSNKVLPALKDFVNNKGISKSLGAIPHPLAQTASQVANAFGYGEGGVLLGGLKAGEGMVGRKQLQHRMKNY